MISRVCSVCFDTLVVTTWVSQRLSYWGPMVLGVLGVQKPHESAFDEDAEKRGSLGGCTEENMKAGRAPGSGV